MKAGKNVFIFIFLLQLVTPSFAKAGFVIQERNTAYDLKFDLKWYEKVVALFLQYEFLSWKEFVFQELFIKTNADSPTNAELIIVSITPKNFNEAIFLRDAGSKTWGFIRFIKYEEFSVEGAKKLLEIVNYLYQTEEGKMEFQSVNLLLKNADGLNWIRWQITKIKQKNKIFAKIVILQPESPKNDKVMEGARLEIILEPLERIFEKITIEIKNGPKITITKKL